MELGDGTSVPWSQISQDAIYQLSQLKDHGDIYDLAALRIDR